MYRIALIGLALFITGCEEDLASPAFDTGMEEVQRGPAANRSVTITVTNNVHYDGETHVTYTLPNGDEKKWFLVGECHSGANRASVETDEALEGCTLTCNNFNDEGDCDDCDIDCSSGGETSLTSLHD